MDIDEEKLYVYGKIAKRISEMINPDLKFSLTTDSKEALRDADFVITDHINIYYNGTETIDKMLDMYRDYIMGEVLGEKLVKDEEQNKKRQDPER